MTLPQLPIGRLRRIPAPRILPGLALCLAATLLAYLAQRDQVACRDLVGAGDACAASELSRLRHSRVAAIAQLHEQALASVL